MSTEARNPPRGRRELGRGERVLPGLWRLRLPLPWTGVPHCNAWAIAAGSGIVLVDCGLHEPGSEAHLARALEQVGLKLEHVRLLVCTHAHSDHLGQAGTVIDRTGCELWLHPAHAHGTSTAANPGQALERRLEVARQCGVPEAALAGYAEQARGGPSGYARAVMPDRELVPGVVLETDLGRWQVLETPGHAPSHVCLIQPERRLLISGDHVLGRTGGLWFDYGWTPDPAGEFLSSLDAVEPLDVRLCLAGHGRPFTDLAGHVQATREVVRERIDGVLGALADEPRTPVQLVPEAYGVQLTSANATWLLSQSLCYLRHLEHEGLAERLTGEGEPQRWRATAAGSARANIRTS